MNEEVLALFAAELLHLGPVMQRWARRRRLELRPAWEKAIPRRVASWAQAGWYDLDADADAT